MSNLVSITREGHVGAIRMLRTEKHNAFNRELSAEVMAALDALEADDEVHATVLT